MGDTVQTIEHCTCEHSCTAAMELGGRAFCGDCGHMIKFAVQTVAGAELEMLREGNKRLAAAFETAGKRALAADNKHKATERALEQACESAKKWKQRAEEAEPLVAVLRDDAAGLRAKLREKVASMPAIGSPPKDPGGVVWVDSPDGTTNPPTGAATTMQEAKAIMDAAAKQPPPPQKYCECTGNRPAVIKSDHRGVICEECGRDITDAELLAKVNAEMERLRAELERVKAGSGMDRDTRERLRNPYGPETKDECDEYGCSCADAGARQEPDFDAMAAAMRLGYDLGRNAR